MINIGVVGYGYWGPNLVRNFAETPGATVAAVADLDPRSWRIVQRRFPAVEDDDATCSELLADPSIDADRHRDAGQHALRAGLAALRAGKHVWLEKPMTETSRAGARS